MSTKKAMSNGGGRRGQRSSERGAIAVMMALLLTTLMGFAALGFDLSYVRLAREEMQNATDAAAHAASITLSITGKQADAAQKAKDIALLNTIMGTPLKLTDADMTFGVYDFTTKTFTTALNGKAPTAVQISGKNYATDSGTGLVNLTFGRALGYSESSGTRAVMSAFSNRYFQVQLDITDSYLCDIDNAVDSAVAFLDFLDDPKTGSPGDWIGLDVFTGRTKEITPMMNVQQHHDADIKPKWSRDGRSTVGSPGSPGAASPQTQGITVCSKNNATPSDGGFGYPAVPGGYRSCAVDDNNPAKQFPYPNHVSMDPLLCSDGVRTLFAGTDPANAIRKGKEKLLAIAQSFEPKILIIITDGVPMACTGIGGGGLCGTSDGNPKPGNWDPCCANGLSCGAGSSGSPNGAAACTEAKAMATDATAAANEAAAAGIAVYTIFFGDPKGTGADFATKLARAPGIGVAVSDSTEIGNKLKDIPARQPVALVR